MASAIVINGIVHADNPSTHDPPAWTGPAGPRIDWTD
jgi:hypothetical protein